MSKRAQAGGAGWIRQRRGDRPIVRLPSKQQMPHKHKKKGH